MKWLPMVLGSLLLVTGCTGTIELTPLDPKTVGSPPVVKDINSTTEQDNLDKGYKGLLVYLPKQVLEIDKFTQISVLGPDKKTMVLSGNCDSDSDNARIQKVVTIVDRTKPYLLQYKHGFLETYTFAVTLTSDGALASINTSSTPDQGKTLANLASAASSAAGIAALGLSAGEKPVCTQTPTFVGYAPLPQIPAGN